MGVGPISHVEIWCWSRLMRLTPAIGPFEVEVLRRMDRECRSYHAEKLKTDEDKVSLVDRLREIKSDHETQKGK